MKATGRAPRGPGRLSRGEWQTALKGAGKGFLDDDCMGLAKEVAYSSLLAFFPTAIALVGLLDILGVYGTLERFLRPVAPHAVLSLISTFRADTGGGGSVIALALGSAGALWTASGAMGSVVKAVNRAYDLLETRPFWKVRIVSIVLVLATAIVLGGTLLLVVTGGTIGRAIDRHAPGFLAVWNVARWPVVFVAVLLFFALVYYLAPNQWPRSWRWITPGSLLGGLAWLGLSGLFALYTSVSSSYTKTYGTLAGGIVLLLWLNYSAWALLLGAEINAELDRQADIHAAGGASAGLLRPARRRA